MAVDYMLKAIFISGPKTSNKVNKNAFKSLKSIKMIFAEILIESFLLSWAFLVFLLRKSVYLQIDEHGNVDKQGQKADWNNVHCQVLPSRSYSQVYSVGMW